MTAHATLGASKSAMWIPCVGSIALNDGLRDGGSTYADWGTACHTLSEWCLTSTPHVGPHDFIGRSIAVGTTTYKVDEEMADVASVYVDYVREVVASTGGQLFVEQRVDYSALIDVPESFGTADAIILAGDELIVVDLKTGRGEEVDARENSQLRLYALGALEEFGLVSEFKQVRLVIVQPRISRKPSEWVDTLEDLEAFRKTARTSAKAADYWLAQKRAGGEVSLEALHPTEKGCRWCKAKAICPKLQADISNEVFGDFEALGAIDPPQFVRDHVDPAEEARVFARLDMIEDWIKARRARAQELAEQGALPGYKLVAGRRGSRAWSNADEAEVALKGMRLKVDEMYEFKLISPTTAEKLLKDSPRRWAKLEALVVQPDGKPTIAPESDKRPALVTSKTADEFDVVGGADDLV